MANLNVNNRLGVIDKRNGRGTAVSPLASDANNKDITARKARLTAISALYTADRLDKMTANDMLYAIRLNDDAAGVK